MEENTLQREVGFILSNIDNHRKVVKSAYSVREHLIPSTISGKIRESDFYRISEVLSPQARSPLWEKYFIEKYKCQEVKKDENSGDLKKNGTTTSTSPLASTKQEAYT